MLQWVAISFSRGSSQPRDQTWVPALQADSLPLEPPGKALRGVLERYKDADQQSEPQKGHSQPLSQSVAWSVDFAKQRVLSA